MRRENLCSRFYLLSKLLSISHLFFYQNTCMLLLCAFKNWVEKQTTSIFSMSSVALDFRFHSSTLNAFLSRKKLALENLYSWFYLLSKSIWISLAFFNPKSPFEFPLQFNILPEVLMSLFNHFSLPFKVQSQFHAHSLFTKPGLHVHGQSIEWENQSCWFQSRRRRNRSPRKTKWTISTQLILWLVLNWFRFRAHSSSFKPLGDL